jgi:hypothetical protein
VSLLKKGHNSGYSTEETQMKSFDFEQAIQGLREGKNLTGKDGILTPLIKQLTEAAL